MSIRRNFSRAFKVEAVRLLSLGEVPVAQLARELGVPRTKLYQWRDQYAEKGDKAFRGPGRPPRSSLGPETLAEENRRLKRELEDLREERDLLKKAAAYFARELS